MLQDFGEVSKHMKEFFDVKVKAIAHSYRRTQVSSPLLIDVLNMRNNGSMNNEIGWMGSFIPLVFSTLRVVWVMLLSAVFYRRLALLFSLQKEWCNIVLWWWQRVLVTLEKSK